MGKLIDAILMIDSKFLEEVLNESNNGINEVYNDYTNQYPIHIAMQTKNKNIIEILINHDVNLNVVDIFGDTPLNIAVKLNLFDITKMLLYNGADQFFYDSYVKYYPIETAIKERKTNFIKLFLQYSHKKNEIDEQTFLYTTIKGYPNLDPEVHILFKKFFKKSQNKKESIIKIRKRKDKLNKDIEELSILCEKPLFDNSRSEKLKKNHKKIINWARILRIKDYKNKSNTELCLALGRYYMLKKRMLIN